MFDRVEISIRSGDGGRGVVSFRREKFVAYGGPDGGDGGRGGDVAFEASSDISNLLSYQHKRHFEAENGGRGGGQRKTGKSGAELLLRVPLGTVITDQKTGEVIADLSKNGDKVIIARGGKGGLGNSHFASSTNQAPKVAQSGEEGIQKDIVLELKLIADAGIIGFPNAGKSSLISAISAAHPKIASYPFTTIEPVLGAVTAGGESFIAAEVPGLIEGAHLGKGLGHYFLRHIARTRVLVHLIDGTSANPVEDMLKINNELFHYDPDLLKKPQIVVINKIDLPEVEARRSEITRSFKEAGIKPYFISAQTGVGQVTLLNTISAALSVKADESVPDESLPEKIFRPQPRPARFSVERDGEASFIVHSPEFERLAEGSEVADAEVRRQLIFQANKMGVKRSLTKMGAKAGDRVKLGRMEWRF